MALEPLKIKEANEKKVISLQSVPSGGATALIPAPPVNDPDSTVLVRINGKVVVPRQPLGVENGGFYEALISRNALLENLGSEQAFDYRIYLPNGNSSTGDPEHYDITH